MDGVAPVIFFVPQGMPKRGEAFLKSPFPLDFYREEQHFADCFDRVQ